MSEQHTNARLHIAHTQMDGTTICIDDEQGACGGRCYYLFTAVHADPDVLQANARRMVASWNACLQVPIETLEALAAVPATGKENAHG